MNWTAWDDVGLAARGGSTALLRDAGLEILSPGEGARLFRDELVFGEGGEVAIAGKPASAPPFDEVLTHQPGVRLVATRTFGPERDAWLADHVIAGSPWLPAVAGIELMARAAALLAPDLRVAEMEKPGNGSRFSISRERAGQAWGGRAGHQLDPGDRGHHGEPAIAWVGEPRVRSGAERPRRYEPHAGLVSQNLVERQALAGLPATHDLAAFAEESSRNRRAPSPGDRISSPASRSRAVEPPRAASRTWSPTPSSRWRCAGRRRWPEGRGEETVRGRVIGLAPVAPTGDDRRHPGEMPAGGRGALRAGRRCRLLYMQEHRSTVACRQAACLRWFRRRTRRHRAGRIRRAACPALANAVFVTTSSRSGDRARPPDLDRPKRRRVVPRRARPAALRMACAPALESRRCAARPAASSSARRAISRAAASLPGTVGGSRATAAVTRVHPRIRRRTDSGPSANLGAVPRVGHELRRSTLAVRVGHPRPAAARSNSAMAARRRCPPESRRLVRRARGLMAEAVQEPASARDGAACSRSQQ